VPPAAAAPTIVLEPSDLTLLQLVPPSWLTKSGRVSSPLLASAPARNLGGSLTAATAIALRLSGAKLR